LAIIGSAYVELRALDTNLQRDIDKAMKKVKEPLITLQSNVNLTPVRDKIRVLREELKKNPLKFSAEVDLEKAEEKINRLREAQAAEVLTIEANADVGAVVASLETVKQQYQSIHADVKADADTALAETQLRLLARNRNTRISAFIDPKTEKALKNLMFTLTGALPADKIKAAIVGLAGNFEGLAIAGAKALTVIGSIGAAGLTLGANAVSIADDLLELVGITALAPAVLSALGAGIAATTLGWKGFSKAMTDEKEMAKLPAKAQDAARSLKGLGGEIRRVTQTSYWEEMGTSVQRLHDNFFPMLKKGMEGTGKAAGKWGKGLADSLWNNAANGNLENIFRNINIGLTNASKAVKPFTDALFELGDKGSNYLSKMGDQLAGLATKFNNWVQKSSQNGNLDKWIMQASDNFEDLGRVIGATWEIFGGFNEAAAASGAKTLDDFANGMEKIADKVNSPEFQTGLVTVLKGARAGSDALGEGFGKIVDVVGKGADTLARFLELSGQIGGGIFTGIAAMFDDTGLGDGIIVALEGAKEAVDILQPAFRDFGEMLGDLAEIAGTLFTSMAPGFVALMATLQGFVAGIKDGIIAAMPIFNEFIQSIISVTSGPIIALGEALGNILEFFAALPGPLQIALMSLAAAALIAPKVEKAYGMMSNGVRGHFTNMKNNARDWGNTMATQISGLDKASRENIPTVRQNFSALNGTIRDGVTATGRGIGDIAKTTSNGVKQSFSQAGSGIASSFVAAGKASASAITGMGRSIKSDIDATVAASKAGFKHIEMESRPLRNNTRYLLEDMADGAKKHTAMASEYVRQHTVYTEKRFSDAAESVKGAGRDISDGFKAVGPNIATQLNPATTAVRGFATDTRQAIAAVASDVTSKYNTASNAVSTAFANTAARVRTQFEPISTAANNVATRTRDSFTRVVHSVADDFRAVGSNVSSAMLPVVAGAERAAQGTRNAFQTARTDISDGMRAVAQNVSSAMLPVGVAAQDAANRVRTGFQNIGQNIANNFAPVNTALRNLGTTAATSMQNAGTAVRNFTSTAGAQISSGLGRALGGLGAAFGGPWAIAIMGVTTAIGLIGAKAEEQKGKVSSLKDAFNGQTGITSAVEEVITSQLRAKDSFLWMESGSAVTAAENIGVSLRDLTLAAEGVPDAMARVKDSVSEAFANEGIIQQGIDVASRAFEGTVFGAIAKHLESDASKVASTTAAMRDRLAAAKAEMQTTADQMGVPVNTASGIISAIDTLTDTASTAEQKMKAAIDVIKQLNGDTSSVADSQQALNDKIRGVEGSWKAAEAAGGKEGIHLKNVFDQTNGSINTTFEAGSKIRTMFKDVADAGIASAAARAMAEENPTKRLAVYQEEIKKTRAALETKMRMAEVDQSTIDKVLSQLDLDVDPVALKAVLESGDKDAIMAFFKGIDEKQLNPKSVPVSVDDQATAPIDAIANKVTTLPNGQPVITLSDGVTYPLSGVQEKIFNTQGKEVTVSAIDGVTLPVYLMNEEIRTNLQGKTVPLSATDGVTAPAGDAKTAMDAVKGKEVPLSAKADTKPISTFQSVLNQIKVPPSPTVTIKDSASAQVAAIQGKINAMKGKEIEIRIKDSASSVIQAIQGKITGMRGNSPIIRAVDSASHVIRSIQASLDGMRDRTVTVTTVQRTVSGGKAANGGIIRSMANMFGGSLPIAPVKAFANGGVEKHVAQISAAQTPYRVWAEPETGGEAYIPLAKAKRSRSVKILEEVARMFGMTLLKTKSFANGGVEGGKSASGGSSSSLSSGRVSAAFVSTVAQEMMKDNRSLNEIGLNVVDGIIGGINSKQGKAVESMTNMAGSLEDAVRERLDIHSPSKAFLALGKYIIDGLTIGIKSTAGTVHKQISTLANRIYVAASDIRKATGKSIGSSMTLLNRQKTLSKEWKKMSAAKFSDQIVDYYQRTGKTGNRTLADIVRAREDVNVRLANAQKRLKDLQTARGDVFKSVSNQINNEYKLGTSIVGQAKPYIPKMKFSDVVNYTSGMAARLKAFNGKIAALRKRGIAPGLIQEVAMLGSIEGTSVADAMLQGTTAEVKNLNSQYSSIASSATAIGNNTADAMYKVGIDAQAGLVRGLQKDSASLTAAANKLTNTLIAQVKRNLGIRSPSRVFAELGRFTGAGFIQGLDQMQPKLDNRVDNFINLDPRQASSVSSAGVTTTTSTSPLADKAITVNVHPTQGMDERQLAAATVREIGWSILSQ
jgi:hypothetical protein